MLRQEQNELLTRAGPGTPMGRLFRCYWIPALLARELPENECPPVRVKLLGERLLAWRDTQGRYSLVDEFCAHRGTSLWVGRNEENGLRCPYHGWKYDWTGQCIEVPSEPQESGFCQKIKLKSYPLVRRGDVLWTYMGPPERTPPLPEWEFATVPAERSYISKRLQECNWLQALEGGIDSSHTSWLHRGSWRSIPCTGARKEINTISATRGRISRWWRAMADFSSGLAVPPTAASTIGASRNGSCRASP
jgi:phthalate 4,5-dioxygenase oxygenase subunit